MTCFIFTDDKNITAAEKTIKELIHILKEWSTLAIDWFKENKFQVLMVKRNNQTLDTYPWILMTQ